MINARNTRSATLPFATSFFLAMLLFLSGGCGWVVINEKYGRLYRFDNAPQIREGMTRQHVVALLGEPYRIGTEQNGDVSLSYEWQQVDGKSFIYGMFFTGENRTVAVSGGDATIILAADSKTVKKIEYKIVGKANYDRLRGGTDDKTR